MSTTLRFIAPQALDEKLANEKEFWLNNIAGVPSPASLPADRPRSAGQETIAEIDLGMDPETASGLSRVCGNNPSLMLVFLIAALKICLRKYSGSEDVTVGTAVHKGFPHLPDINRYVAIRTRVDGSRTVKQLLLDVRQALSEAFANQKYPMDRVAELLNIPEEGGRRELFRTAVFLDSIQSLPAAGDLRADVNMLFCCAGGGLAGQVQYNANIFHCDTIQAFAAHYREVLRSALKNVGLTPREIPLLSAQRRQELVETANRTERAYDLNRTIHQVISESCRRTPDAVALECRGESITFREMEDAACGMRSELRRRGVAIGERVGLCAEHSIGSVVGFLGLLKTGAVCVPLEPSHPPARTAFQIRDAGIRFVLAGEGLASRVLEAGADPIPIDSCMSGPAGEDFDAADPDATAYVIYTSGSTGEAKGVEVAHRSLVNYTLWARDTWLRGEVLSFALYSPLTFDLTLTSVFVPLVSGSRILIYPGGGFDHPLFEVLQEKRAQVVKLTPSHLSMLCSRQEGSPVVRRVIVGGEAFETGLALAASRMFAPDVEIYNEYGPTEATIGCMSHLFQPESDTRSFVPIGLPAANTGIHLLDDDGAYVPDNVAGEIYIAGEGLALGYLNRPELTAERFVNVAGKRMYRTGDLARWLPQNVIEYCGRRDDQVKYHGHRIELSEIRVALNRHPAVSDSAAMAGPDALGNPMLVAYYASPQPVETKELREFLLQQFPREVVPNAFVHMSRIPLTSNGKIDRNALPNAAVDAGDSAQTFVAPRSQTEELLAGIWSQTLGKPQISATADFFELGGHSLVAHQIISRISSAMHIDLPMRLLFETATVQKLAAAVDQMVRQNAGVAPQRIVPSARRQNVPLSFGQQRLWFIDQLEPGRNTYNLFPAFEILGALNVGALEHSFTEIIRRHEALRTAFRAVSGVPWQEIAAPRPVSLNFTDLSATAESARDTSLEKILQEELAWSFSLRDGLLIRPRLIRLKSDHHVLFVSFHHIASDAASMGIFHRELAELYTSACARTAPRLRPLPVQYADYAVWQRTSVQNGLMEAQARYWRQQLANLPPVLDLMPGRRRSGYISDRGTYIDFSLAQDVSAGIKEFSQRQRCTVFMALLAAFYVVLRHSARRDDIVVGADIANRTRPEIEDLIGFFINTLVLRTSLAGDPAFTDLLARVRDGCLNAFAQQDLPFEKLVEELNPDRDGAQNPLFQVMFGFVDNGDELAMKLPGLSMRRLAVDNGKAPFEFSIYMTASGRGLTGTARFQTDLYSEQTIHGFLDNFKQVLQLVLQQPNVKLSELDSLQDRFEKQKTQNEAGMLRRKRLSSFQAHAGAAQMVV